MDINFTKFALSCPEESLITAEVKPSANVQQPNAVTPPKPATNTNTGIRPNINQNFPEEKECCELL